MTGRALPALLATGGLLLAAVLAVLVVARGDLVEDDGEPTTFLLSGQADVPPGQVHDDVYVLRGTAVVRGTVEDDVVVVDGRARIIGTVNGDVTVVRGDAVVERGAEINGDLRTSEPATVSRRATVDGEISGPGPLDALAAIPLLVWLGTWFAAGVSVLVLLGIGRRPLAGPALAGIRRPGRAIVLGSVVMALAPFVIAVLALSLLGSLLAVIVACGLVVATAVGAAVTGAAAGRAMLPRHALAPFVGWAVVGGALLLGLLVSPVLALLLAGGVVAFGVGALVPVRQAADSAPVEDEPDPDDLDEDDHIDWDALLPDEPGPEVDDAEPRILAAFPLTNGSTRD